MKYYLVLGIIEGRDWNPKEGSRTVIEAHLNNHKLSTNVFPLTNSPKFNTEVTWEAEKQIFRSYKINRVPIKIVCYALDEKNDRKLLGYIVLPLTSAVEGVEGDSKWYKLLGGSKRNYKTPPSILLRLHMEAMKLEHNQMNGKETSEKNGSRSEDCQISSIAERKNKILQQVNLKTVAAKANENGETQPFIQYALQNSFHMNTSNGNFVQNVEEEMNQIDSDNMEEGEIEEEELLDSEGEYLEEEEDEDPLGMIAGAYSLKNYEENENTLCSGTTMEEPVSFKSREPIPTHSHSNPMVINSSKAGSHTCKTTENTSPQKGDSGLIKNPEVDQLLKIRTSAVDHLKKLSEDLLSSNRERQTSQCSSLIKRLSDTSGLLDISNEHKSRKRKLENSMEISCTDSLQKSENFSEMGNLNATIQNKLSQNRDATATGALLSYSIGETSEHKETEAISNCKYSLNAKLIPELNTEDGCFYIRSEDGEIEEFLFSVSIIYAKNLDKLMPEDSSGPVNEGYQFCYSLLGCPIYTDPFINLNDTVFVNETASSKIRTSRKSLSLYFGQHPFLPFYFMNGEDALGACNVDIGYLMDVATNNKVKFEEVYQVNSMNDRFDLSKSDSKHKPVVAIAIEVLKSNENINVDASNKSARHLKPNINEVDISDSASSSSELIEDFNHKSKVRKSKRRYSLKNYLNEEKALNAEMSFEREKKFMLLEAAYEIEQWKEEKRKLFIKDWSAKEETFQRLLATEWSSKVKLIEEELNNRILECDKLQEKLNTGLSELSLREEKCKLKENQNKRLEEELLLEKDKLQLRKLKDTFQGNDTAADNEISTKRFQLVKYKNEQLEEEVRRLKEELRITNETINIQSQEVINLRKKLVLSDDLIGASNEKEILQKKIDHLQDRKQYYKGQWLSALTDFHKLHSEHKRTIKEISCTNKNFSREEPVASSSSSSTTGIKLKKLKDDRQILIRSGRYSPNHSIIKNIDKKIKELIG